jgi:hypothetical protein
MNTGTKKWRAVLDSLKDRVLELDPENRDASIVDDRSLHRDVDVVLRALSPLVTESMPMWSQRFNNMDLGDRLLFVTDNVEILTDHRGRTSLDMIRSSLYPPMVHRANEKDLAIRMVDIASHGRVMLDVVSSLWARLEVDGTLSPVARHLSTAAGYRLLEEVYREISTSFCEEIGIQASVMLKQADLAIPSAFDPFARSPEIDLSRLYWSCHLMVSAVEDFYGPEFVDYLYRYSE